MSCYVPQPRYSIEHREQAVRQRRPLFTLDIYHYPRKSRTTSTGVATNREIDEMIARLQRLKELL